MIKKLNFGCGTIQPQGWDNVDKEVFGQLFVGSTDIFDNDTYDVIVAHASIQCTEWHSIPALLKELHRILKPGGILRISLPDIYTGFKAWESGVREFFPNSEEHIDEKFSAWLTWYSTTKSLLTPTALRLKLMEAGFDPASIFRVKFGQGSKESAELDTRKDEFYFMEARK